jgi:hypothetical protein
MKSPAVVVAFAAVAAAAVVLSVRAPARAHCDGMDGPVVAAAREALKAGDVSRVLHWVSPEGEPEVRDAFAKAVAVRKLGPEAQDLADLHFFETLVRVHRAGEGEPFTGLKPAGRDLGPAIPAADRSLEDGNVEPVVKLLQKEVEEGVRARFRKARAAKGFRTGDVPAGREFVEAYVDYVHFVEALHDLAAHGPSGHGGEGHPVDDEPGGHRGHGGK